MSGEPPFIELDEGELDPLMDAARLLEQTGERWLSFSEAVALLREREQMSIGQAQAIIDDLRVTYFAGGGPFARQSGKFPAVRCFFCRGIGLFGEKPHRENTLISEADLIYWQDTNRSTSMPAPSPAPPPRTPAPRTSRAQIRKIVAEYRRTNPNGTMDDAVQFAENNGVTGHREEVRAEYRQQFGHPRVGRRSK